MRFYLTKADGATWADGDGSHWVACFFGWTQALVGVGFWLAATSRSMFPRQRLPSSLRTPYREKWSQLTRLLPVPVGQRTTWHSKRWRNAISGDDSHQKTEAAFRREMVKLIEAKTNGLVADASTR